jgi:hypothetical protein
MRLGRLVQRRTGLQGGEALVRPGLVDEVERVLPELVETVRRGDRWSADDAQGEQAGDVEPARQRSAPRPLRCRVP